MIIKTVRVGLFDQVPPPKPNLLHMANVYGYKLVTETCRTDTSKPYSEEPPLDDAHGHETLKTVPKINSLEKIYSYSPSPNCIFMLRTEYTVD